MPEVKLALLPEKRPTTVVVGTSVRKQAGVLRHYLASLGWQDVPPNVVLKPVFVEDNLDADAGVLLRQWTAAHNGEILRGAPAPAQDFQDVHPDSHQWSATAMQRVGAAKDRILARARELDADYVWLCDADVICDTTTLASMLAVAQPIVTAVYWTHWSQRGTETRKIHAAPQVWLRHPYELAGRGYTEAEFRSRLAARQLTRVPGYGACTLIDKRALNAGVSFAYVPGVPLQGLMAGEDRHFCLRSQALHLESWADPWPDIFHIYHLPPDLNRAPSFASRLQMTHPASARLGDLVNLTLQAIEPIPWAGGGYTAVPAQHVRGRLGQIALLPELEEAVYDLKRGEQRTVAVHFPVHYEVPVYQGRRRLIRVTLNDVKENCWAPTLEDELFLGPNSGASLRTVDYNAKQLAGMKEVANG